MTQQLLVGLQKRTAKSTYVEPYEYCAFVMTKNQKGFIEIFSDVGIKLKKGNVIPIFDLDRNFLFYGELHQTQISKIIRNVSGVYNESFTDYYESAFDTKKVLNREFRMKIFFLSENEAPNNANICVYEQTLETPKIYDNLDDEEYPWNEILARFHDKHYFKFNLSKSEYVDSELVSDNPINSELIGHIGKHIDKIVLSPPQNITSHFTQNNFNPINRHYSYRTKLNFKPHLHSLGFPMLLIQKRVD